MKVYEDPRQATLWEDDARGVDSLHLAIFSNLLPPEALENPRKYRPQIHIITERLHHLASLSYVAPANGASVHEGARPTGEGITYVSLQRRQRPWWRLIWERFSEA